MTEFHNHRAFLSLPICCVLSALATCWSCIHVSVKKKYVRHPVPLVCMAGAKKECLLMFGIGGCFTVSLYTATAWVWFMAYREKQQQEEAEETAMNGDDTFRLNPAVWVGPILATVASVAFAIMCWFSMYGNYSKLHDMAGSVGFTSLSTWGGFLLGATRRNSSTVIFAVRLFFYLGGVICLLVLQGFLDKAKKMKKSWQARDDGDEEVDDSANNAANRTENGERKQHKSTNNASEDWYATCKPWDQYVRYAAFAEYASLAFYGGLILTITVDFMD